MFTAQDNAVKVQGKHEFNFGFQFEFEDVPKSIVSAAGDFNVDTGATSSTIRIHAAKSDRTAFTDTRWPTCSWAR